MASRGAGKNVSMFYKQKLLSAAAAGFQDCINIGNREVNNSCQAAFQYMLNIKAVI